MKLKGAGVAMTNTSLEGESAVYLRTQLEAFACSARDNDISEQMRKHRTRHDVDGDRTGRRLSRQPLSLPTVASTRYL